jgi:hypothetical protein
MDIKKSGLNYLKHHPQLNNLVKWVWRYIKFSIVGVFVWGISTVLFVLLFPFIGEYAWVVTLGTGIIEFILLSVVNKHSRGVMFESHLSNGETLEFQIKKKKSEAFNSV